MCAFYNFFSVDFTYDFTLFKNVFLVWQMQTIDAWNLAKHIFYECKDRSNLDATMV